MNQVIEETFALVKGLQANDDLAKTISQASGLTAYDLQAPAKNLYPFLAPLRHVIPRVGNGTGTATNWKEVQAIIGSGFDAMGWVPEGQRSGAMSYTTANKSANYVTIGEEDAATEEAIAAAQGFENLRATMSFRLLQKALMKEEMGILGGNTSMALGTPGTPTLSASGSGATLPAATYYVRVVAMTIEGYNNYLKAGVVPSQTTVTGADGETYTVNGGSSNLSAEADQAVTLGQTLFCSVAAIQGAVAYAWFVSTSTGTEILQAVTTINSTTFAVALATGTQNISTFTADFSANTTAFDGLLTNALKSGSGAYVNSLATGTAGTGTGLTSSGRGSINEIDTMLETMWNSYRLSPTVLYVNAQEARNITTLALSNSSGPLVRYEVAQSGGYQLTASGTIEWYYNPFQLNAGQRIPLKIHPYLPPGTIIGWAENLPVQYQSNEVPNVAEVKTRRDWYEVDWPLVTRKREVGVYAQEVLAVYAPFAMGVITNIANIG